MQNPRHTQLAVHQRHHIISFADWKLEPVSKIVHVALRVERIGHATIEKHEASTRARHADWGVVTVQEQHGGRERTFTPT